MKKTAISFLLFCSIGSAVADTETLTWYVGGNLYDTTTCETGNDIVLPTAPTKRGYTFNGWTSGIYDMSTLDTSINGTTYYYRTSGGSCYVSTDGTNEVAKACTDNDFADLGGNGWKVVFSYGTVYGSYGGFCQGNVPVGSTSTSLTTGSSGCGFGWCKVTGFVPTGDDFKYEPLGALWTFAFWQGNLKVCPQYTYSNASMRAGLYSH